MPKSADTPWRSPVALEAGHHSSSRSPPAVTQLTVGHAVPDHLIRAPTQNPRAVPRRMHIDGYRTAGPRPTMYDQNVPKEREGIYP
jgi:hypothetical protein